MLQQHRDGRGEEKLPSRDRMVAGIWAGQTSHIYLLSTLFFTGMPQALTQNFLFQKLSIFPLLAASLGKNEHIALKIQNQISGVSAQIFSL